MLKILVVAPASDLAEALSAALPADQGAQVLSAGGLQAAADMAAAGRADLLVVGPSIASDLALEAAERLRRQSPATAVVLVVQRLTTEVLRMALKAGVRDVVSAEDGLPEIVRAVTEAMAHLSERMEAAKPAESVGRDGRVVTVFSTKGGVGKTVIATNLAVALVQKCRKRVALLDLDLQFGDVGIMLQTPPERTLFDVAQNFDRLDLDMLRGFLTPHDSGVLALLAPVQPEQAEYVTTARIARIVDMLRQLVDYVVIDTPAALNDVVLAALDKSDVICAITQMDVASLKNTRIALQKLDQLGYDQGAVRVVLNRADSKVLLQPSDVKNAIQREIAVRVPSDRLVPQSVNKGVPVVIDAGRSLVARSIFDLATRIDEDGAEVPQNVA